MVLTCAKDLNSQPTLSHCINNSISSSEIDITESRMRLIFLEIGFFSINLYLVMF